MFNLDEGENILQSTDFVGFYDIGTLTILFKDVLPEKLQSYTVNLCGTPETGFDQIGEILFRLLYRQFVGITMEMLSIPLYGVRIRINGHLTFILDFESPQMVLVKFVKSVNFGLFHCILLFI